MNYKEQIAAYEKKQKLIDEQKFLQPIKLTPEQIENWRNTLFLLHGTIITLMKDADIEMIVNKILAKDKRLKKERESK